MNERIKALNFMFEAHKGQVRRDTGLPYAIHPVTVAMLYEEYFGDEQSHEYIDVQYVICLLHDVIEDTFITPEALQTYFNEYIAVQVQGMTTPDGVDKFEYLKDRLRKESCIYRKRKLCDILANAMDRPTQKWKDGMRDVVKTAQLAVDDSATQVLINRIKGLL